MLLLPYVIANNAQPTKTRIQSSSNDEQQALIQYLKKQLPTLKVLMINTMQKSG